MTTEDTTITIANCYRLLIRVATVNMAREALSQIEWDRIPETTYNPPSNVRIERSNVRIERFVGVCVEIGTTPLR